MKAYEGKVYGRVQGVGYRYYARENAEDLQVTGWVRNLPDGSVEFHGEGAPENLDEWLRRLKRGPLSGRVERLVGDGCPPLGGYFRFDIK